MVLLLFFLFCFLELCLKSQCETSYTSEHTIGLENDIGDICMSVTFRVEVLNTENNNTEALPFNLANGKISGKCAIDRKHDAIISSTIEEENGRVKKLKFAFRTEEMHVKRVDELRWQLKKVEYTEKYEGNTAVFESDNSSVIFSAPLTQKYVCEDSLNVTLQSDEFNFPIVIMFYPEIDVQPYGPKSNSFLCERTRRRTLSDSLQHRSTIFAGVILAISSIAHIIGHMVRRHFMPQRKEIYESLTRS